MDIWAAAVYDLGLSEAQFWKLTPAKLAYLIDRKEASEKYTDSRFGMIVSTMVNLFVGKKGGKPVTPLGVMGYDEDNHYSDDPSKVPTQQERELSQKATALKFRLLQAGQKWRGIK